MKNFAQIKKYAFSCVSTNHRIWKRLPRIVKALEKYYENPENRGLYAKNGDSRIYEYHSYLQNRWINSGFDEKYAPLHPPSSRRSRITKIEAFALSGHCGNVPTLEEIGEWPQIHVGDSPDKLTCCQKEFLLNNWWEILFLFKKSHSFCYDKQ